MEISLLFEFELLYHLILNLFTGSSPVSVKFWAYQSLRSIRFLHPSSSYGLYSHTDLINLASDLIEVIGLCKLKAHVA